MLFHATLCLLFVIVFGKGDIEEKYRLDIVDTIKCTHDFYENNEASAAYKNLKKNIENELGPKLKQHGGNGISYNFKSFDVTGSTCEGSNVVVEGALKFSNISMSMSDAETFKVEVLALAKATTRIKEATVGPLITEEPPIFIRFSGSIAKRHVCNDVNQLKNELSRLLFFDDGVQTATIQQIVFPKHPCRGDQDDLLSNAELFISKVGMVSVPDSDLTTLAYQIIQQMIYDGTTWRLGIHLHKQIKTIELVRKIKVADALSDSAIVYIGFGAVCALLFLVIVSVLIGGRLKKTVDKDIYSADTAEPDDKDVAGVKNETAMDEVDDVQQESYTTFNELPEKNDVYEDIHNEAYEEAEGDDRISV